MKTYTLKQLRNAYEYMVSHGRTSINEARFSGLVETADVWDQNGRRDCFVTGDLSVEVKKVPDSELKPYYREAVRIVKETFPEQAEIMVEAYVRLCMFTEIATSALKDIASGNLHPRSWVIAPRLLLLTWRRTRASSRVRSDGSSGWDASS